MEISNEKIDKENNSINFDFSNLDVVSKGNIEENNNNENDEFNVSNIDIEDTNDLYMPDEKINLDDNKGDIIEELVKEIKINNKSDENNKNDKNLKNIFLQCDTNFSTKFITYNNETLSNDKKGKTFINKKTKRK